MRILSRLFRKPSPPLPRDHEGRFISAHRLQVIATAQQMRRELGLPDHEAFQ